MRILIVSPYPPAMCGLASYTVQLAAALREEGHVVNVLSREPSAARYHADLHTGKGMRTAIALSRRADRTIIQFQGEHLFASFTGRALMQHLPWFGALLMLGRNVELIVHEWPYADVGRASGLRGRLSRSACRVLAALPSAVYVHTEWEREQLVRAAGVKPSRIGILDHGASFVKRFAGNRDDARRELGLDPGKFHFLCIGFIQPHKGIDRAIRALARLDGRRAHLHIVGSARISRPDIEQYVRYLRHLASTVAGVTFHEEYVTDVDFDRWIAASDVLVLPYQTIWSSGVLARAKLYGTPAIVSSAGGMPDQVRVTDLIVHSDEELCHAMARLAGAPMRPQPPPMPDSPQDAIDPVVVSEYVRSQANELRRLYAPIENWSEPTLSGGRDLPAPVRIPEAPTGGGVKSRLKRAVHRLTRWQLAQLVEQVEALRLYCGHLQGAVAELNAALSRQRAELADLRRTRSQDRAELTSALAAMRANFRGDLVKPTGAGEPNGEPSPTGFTYPDPATAAFYEAHQDRFRGSRELVRGRLEPYLTEVVDVAQADGLVLDIGPGRCEWLELLRENGIRAYGVDINQGFVRLACEKGFDVKLGDGLEHLQAVAEGSLAVITAFHVVEHLPIPHVLDLIDHSLRALRPGGLLIIETPNPVNVSVGAGAFYLDPTHVRPMHPLLLKFMLEHRGFAEVRQVPMNPPDIPPITVASGFNSDMAKVAEVVNRNFLTGQDVAVMGTAVKRHLGTEGGAAHAGPETSTPRRRRVSHETA